MRRSTPRWSGGFGVNYATPVSDGVKLKLNANYAFESNSYFTAANERQVSTGGWHRLDARAGVELDNGCLSMLGGSGRKRVTLLQPAAQRRRFGQIVEQYADAGPEWKHADGKTAFIEGRSLK